MITTSASEVRQTLPAQLDRIEAGAEVAITRRGRVVAVLVSPAALAVRRAPRAFGEADLIGSLLERAAKQPLAAPSIDAERAEALVAGLQADRSPRRRRSSRSTRTS